MKKILSVLIVFSILLQASFICAAAGDNTADVKKDTDLEGKTGFLQYLGVVSKEDDVRAFDSAVTRGEFAGVVARIVNSGASPKASNNYFEDIELSSDTGNAINFLAEQGIVNGTDAGSFMPEEQIEARAAIKMLICALGYKDYAEAAGGYPSGYMKAAGRLKLFSGVKTDTNLDYGSMIELVYDALLSNTCEVSGIKNGNLEWRSSDEETLLRRYFKLVNAEGKITGVKGLSLENIYMYDNQFSMGGNIYEYTGTSNEDWVGVEYSVFYQYDTSDSLRKCVYMFPTDNEGCLKIDADLITGFGADYRLTYYETQTSDKKKDANISKDAVIYFNGEVRTKDISKVFDNIETGYVKLMDLNQDGVYEYVSVKSYTNIVVSAVDKSNDVIHDKIRNTVINLKGIDTVRIKDGDGNEYTTESLKENMVISAAVSNDYAELLVSTNVINGKIQSVSEDKIVISDNEYNLEKKFAEEFSSQLNPGTGGEFFLNYFGDIVYQNVKSADGFLYGYMYNLSVEAKAFGDNIAYVKIFSETGKVIKTELAEKVEVDGDIYRSTDKIVSAIPGCSVNPNEFKRQMLRYSLDADGKVNKLDTTYFNADKESIHSSIRQSVNHPLNGGKTYALVSQTTANQNSNQVKRIGLSNMVNSSVKVMNIPSDSEFEAGTVEDKNFSLGKVDSLGNQSGRTVYSFRTDIEGGYEEVVLMVDSGLTKQADTYLMIVDEISEAINDEDEVVCQISGMQKALPVTFELTKDAANGNAPIEKGDTILPVFNSAGKVADYYMIYDYSAGGYPDKQVHKIDESDGSTSSNWKGPNWFMRKTENEQYYQSCQISFSYAGYLNGNILKGYYTNNPNIDLGENDEIYDLSVSSFMFYDPDKDGGKAVVGKVSDIRDIKTYGSECSKILYQTNGLMPRGIVIYK